MATKAIDRFAYSRNGGGVDERCLIRVNILGVTEDAQATRYIIHVTNIQTRQAWQTSHRYSEFLALRTTLLTHFEQTERKCPGCVNFEKVIKLFEFPTKRLFTSKNKVVINYRKTALRAFLSLLASHTFTNTPKCPSCSGVPFTAVRDFLTEESATPSSPTNSASSSGEVESIRESIQVKNFTTYIPPAKKNAVNSDGLFIRQGSAGTSVKPVKQSSRSQKKTPKSKKVPEPAEYDLESPVASKAPVKTTLKSPAMPTRADLEQARREEESFLSFSGRTSDKEVPSSQDAHPSVQKQSSAKESEDDEFGSLNMDFLKNVSVAN